MSANDPHRASAARPPAPSPLNERQEIARQRELASRLTREQRSLVRGLLLLALVVLIWSLHRAGPDRLFVPGWWRQW